MCWSHHSRLCAAAGLLPSRSICHISPGVKIGRAKQLLNANFKKIADVAQAEPHQLTEVIQFLTKTKVELSYVCVFS